MIDIFKVSIHSDKLKINNKKLISYILGLKKKIKGRHISSPTGWQSGDLNLEEKIFLPLIKQISNNFLDYKNKLLLKGNFKISNMWANVNSYKDYNQIHGHGSSVVSGVYYLNVPKNSGKIFFVHPASQLVDICWKECTEEYNEQNSPIFFVNGLKSHLLLFPGWLHHGVRPNLNKKNNRISISFDISKI
tara:strand:- start:586 stop:1155 length:570 start_codon:yes stop_codon:yes gene_type:complete